MGFFAAGDAIKGTFVDDDVKELVFVLEIHAIHYFPDHFGPKIFVSFFHLEDANVRNVDVMDVWEAVVVHFFAEDGVAAAEV